MFNSKLALKHDYFGHDFNMLPRIDIDISTLKSHIDDFAAFEKQYTAILLDLQQVTSDNKKLTDTLTGLKGKVRSNTSKQTELVDQANDLLTRVTHADKKAERARKELEADFETLQQAIEDLHGCQTQQFMSTLGMCMMFAETDNPAAMVGAGLSLAGSQDPNSVDGGPSGKVNNQYVLKKTEQIEATVIGLNEGYENVGDLITPDDPNAVQLLIAKKQFDSLYSQYLDTMQGSVPDKAEQVKEKFDAYFNAVQQRNLLIRRYNGAVVEYQKLFIEDEILGQQERDISAAIAVEAASLTTLEFMKGFAAGVYEQWKNGLIYDLYTCARAVYCLMLNETVNPLASWTELETPSLLDSTAMLAAYESMTGTLQTVLNQINTQQPVTRTVTVTLDHEKHKYLLEGLKEQRSIQYALNPKTVDDFKGMHDVRLLNVRVHLVGAVHNDRQVSVEVAQGGLFTVADLDGKSYELNYDGFSIPYAYTYGDPNKPDTFKDATHAEFKNICTVKFGGKQPISAPLRSPYGTWTIDVTGQGADLSKLTSVILVFEVAYRSALA